MASWSYAVLADVSICYPPVWDRLFTRYSPVRRWNIQCASTPNIPARLACVKHAASVRPEPGSNSYVQSFHTLALPRASGSPKPSALIALACCLLSQNLTVPALTPPSVAPPGSLALLFLLCIVFKVRSPPSSRAPQRSHRPSQPRARTRSFQAARIIISKPLLFVKPFFSVPLHPIF